MTEIVAIKNPRPSPATTGPGLAPRCWRFASFHWLRWSGKALDAFPAPAKITRFRTALPVCGNGPSHYSVVVERGETRSPDLKATTQALRRNFRLGTRPARSAKAIIGKERDGHGLIRIARHRPQRSSRVGIVAGALLNQKRKTMTCLPLTWFSTRSL